MSKKEPKLKQGIISNQHEEEVANFLINEGYEPFDVIPLCCVLSGSMAYGMSVDSSDRDYLGVHIMSTWDCLEHPDFRPRSQVIKQRYDTSLKPIPNGEKGGDISLDSFEIWKFISLYLKGSVVPYELLYLPAIHMNPESQQLFHLMREGITSRIGKAARGIAVHEWAKHKTNRKKTVLTYYRLMQAIMFLREREFEWNIGNLLEYMEGSNIVNIGKVVIGKYCEPEMRTAPVFEVDEVGVEIHRLIDEVDKAGVTTLLPDQVPAEVLKAILQRVKRTRSVMI